MSAILSQASGMAERAASSASPLRRLHHAVQDRR
jgi:hypothetical protein